MLELQPIKAWKSTDLKSNGTQMEFSFWEYGLCEEYDVETEKQMKRTIAVLISKIDILKQIKEKYDINFSLQVVPSLYAHNDTPTLGSDLDIIDFCHETRTSIDIDLYIMD